MLAQLNSGPAVFSKQIVLLVFPNLQYVVLLGTLRMFFTLFDLRHFIFIWHYRPHKFVVKIRSIFVVYFGLK